MTHARRTLWLSLIATSLATVAVVHAQEPADQDAPDHRMEQGEGEVTTPEPPHVPAMPDLGVTGDPACAVLMAFMPGMEAAEDELLAWQCADAGHHIRARELAEAVIRRDPDSFAGHFVLAHVHHYGEANFPRALFHATRAYELYTRRFGQSPVPPAPWRWHARILRELAFAHSELDHYEEQLAWMARYNETYQPRMVAETAWPLMKLRRFDDARRAAQLAQAMGEGMQTEIALNALCAVEFEAGDEQASYRACRAAMELHGADPDQQSAVDFTNFAEAARSVFRFDEAEEAGLLATRAMTSWYGNPHVELSELYTRQGRFLEALAQLRDVHPYRRRRPPHVQDADLNEARRALAEFYLTTGRSEDALRITHRALIAPDRRGHNSRDPAQDLAIAALLDRAARRLHAANLESAAVGGSVFERIGAAAQAWWLRIEAWQSGRQAARSLADDARLVGTFQIGRSRSAVLQPWLAGELVDVLGPGVVVEAVRRARAEDHREGAPAYYDAFEAEAALAAGDADRAWELSQRALAALNPAEALLRARVQTLAAEAARASDHPLRALAAYDEAFQVDPGVFVRRDARVPVRIIARGDEVATEVADLLAGSPRFEVDELGLVLEVSADRSHGRACLSSSGGAGLGCSELDAQASESADDFAVRLARTFTSEVFAPRVELSQTDANSLDGSNGVMRDGLRTLLPDRLMDE